MRSPGGYAHIISPVESLVRLEGVGEKEIPPGVMELDTFGCGHCGRVTHVMPRMDPANLGGHCKICYRLICKYCVGHGCDPLEAKLERSEARDRARRSYGL